MKRLLDNRIIIICGHYGTGKTNIAVNLCEYAALNGNECIIADLDIVNPYFRTADNAEYLKTLGVKTLIPQYANTNVDLPMIPSGLPLVFTSDAVSVIDVGGDNGAIVLAGFAERFEKCGYSMFYVYNRFRPENKDLQLSEESLKEIEKISKLKFNGIINNSNLGEETTKEMVAESIKHAEDFAQLVKVPLLLTTSLFDLDIEKTTTIKNITKKYF